MLHNYAKFSYLYPMQVSEHKIKGKSITVKKADVKPGKVIMMNQLYKHPTHLDVNILHILTFLPARSFSDF